MKRHISVASLVMLAGGAVTFLFSFAPFYSGDGGSTSAWGSGLFPMATLIALMGLAMAVVAVLDLLDVKLPGEILTFNWRQINVVWGITAAGFLLAFMIADKGSGGNGFGLIVMFLGSLAMCAGSILALLGKGTNMIGLPGSEPRPAPAGPMTPPPPPPPGSAMPGPGAPGSSVPGAVPPPPPPSAPPPPPPPA